MRWERGERGGEESGGEQREEKESAHMAKINRKGVYWLSTIVQGRVAAEECEIPQRRSSTVGTLAGAGAEGRRGPLVSETGREEVCEALHHGPASFDLAACRVLDPGRFGLRRARSVEDSSGLQSELRAHLQGGSARARGGGAFEGCPAGRVDGGRYCRGRHCVAFVWCNLFSVGAEIPIWAKRCPLAEQRPYVGRIFYYNYYHRRPLHLRPFGAACQVFLTIEEFRCRTLREGATRDRVQYCRTLREGRPGSDGHGIHGGTRVLLPPARFFLLEGGESPSL